MNNLFELEEARHALVSDNSLSLREKAVQAERLGDYRTAAKLWRQVLMQKDDAYAYIRHKFCETAVKQRFGRPELAHLYINT